jgi:hypothetical protein
MGFNKKKKSNFVYLMWRIFKEKLNQHRDADRLIVKVARFVMI